MKYKKMLMESFRALGFLPQFSKFLRVRPIEVKKSFSTVLPSQLEDSTEVKHGATQNSPFDKFRFHYPEFLTNTDPRFRNAVREKLERREMLRRRNNIHIPQFYVGSILAVTTSDKHVPKKISKFVGICIQRKNCGLNSVFLLRNVIEHHGVEVMYHLYSPVIHSIEVLRLEKRLDDELLYLRDAPNEYSTFPMDMLKEYHDDDKQVPINPIKVPLNPRPWIQRYERMNLKGVILPELSEKVIRKAKENAKPWEKYDLMDEYRKTVPEEDQKDIFSEICDELKQLELRFKSEKRKKVFSKPTKQKLF